MLDLHIERDEPKETEAEKKARDARETESVIANLRQRGFIGGRWATDEDLMRADITEPAPRGLSLS